MTVGYRFERTRRLQTHQTG